MRRSQTFISSSSKIYIVATPIGNFDDITLRALEVLKSVDYIYCEDTRNTLQLLSHFNIESKLRSYHMFNENETTDSLINVVKEGHNVAVVSDAGMPCISDPGFVAVKEAREQGIDVVMVPGVSAGLTAICGSGLPCNHFYFYGFLNSKESKRIDELKQLEDISQTIIFYEAPHRIKETLQNMLDIFGDRHIVLARELTKKYEEYLDGNISEVLEVCESLKGEMVIVCEGAHKEDLVKDLLKLTIQEHYDYYINMKIDRKEALKLVAKDRGVSKSDIYSVIFGKNKGM